MEHIDQIEMKEKSEELVCLPHKQQPEYVIMDPDLPSKERLACRDCLKNRGEVQPMTITQVKSMIEENKRQRSEQADQVIIESIARAKQIENHIDETQSKIMQKFEQMKSTISNIIKNLEKQKKENLKYSFYEELESLVNGVAIPNQEIIKTIQQFNINWFGKLKTRILSFPQDLENTLKKARTSTIELYEKNYHEIYKPLDLNLIDNNNVKQKDPCYSLVFSKTDDLIFTGCGKYIKIWNFDQGKMKEVTKLYGHVLSVTCMVTSSKVKNSLISCGECGSLIIWKQKSQKEWDSRVNRSQWANSIILNKSETQVYLATTNFLIQIWDVDFNQNKLSLIQELDNYHTSIIFDLSINQAETYLISTDADNKIIIWNRKNQDSEWELAQEITQQTYSTKIAFVTDFSFVWIGYCQKGSDNLIVYDLNSENQFSANPKKLLQLDKDEKQNDHHLNPVIYNKHKDVYLLRFKRHVYILKIQNGEFQVVTKLKYETNQIFATLSQDADYIVTYTEEKQIYEVHKIIWQ